MNIKRWIVALGLLTAATNGGIIATATASNAVRDDVLAAVESWRAARESSQRTINLTDYEVELRGRRARVRLIEQVESRSKTEMRGQTLILRHELGGRRGRWRIVQETSTAQSVWPGDGTNADDSAAAEQLKLAVNSWRAAWESKDVDTLLAFYAPSFHSAGLGRSGLRKKKTRLFKRPGEITVGIFELLIDARGDHGRADFRQKYSSSWLTDDGTKTLHWRRQRDGAWRITSEVWIPSTMWPGTEQDQASTVTSSTGQVASGRSTFGRASAERAETERAAAEHAETERAEAERAEAERTEAEHEAAGRTERARRAEAARLEAARRAAAERATDRGTETERTDSAGGREKAVETVRSEPGSIDIDRRRETDPGFGGQDYGLTYSYLANSTLTNAPAGGGLRIAQSLTPSLSVLVEGSYHKGDHDRAFALGGFEYRFGRQEGLNGYTNLVGGLINLDSGDLQSRGFSVGGGGGLDLNRPGPLSLRLVQVDILQNFGLDEFIDNGQTFDIRVSSGLVFRFGSTP